MKISKGLPQFTKISLIIAAGSHSAEIYRAYEGEIEKIDSFRMENPTYSDKEGFFSRSGKGMNYGSGSVIETNKEEILGKFTKELASRIEKLFKENNAGSTYIFSPNYIKKSIRDSLSQKIKDCMVYTMEGNFVENHPFDLIKMIQKKTGEKKPVIASESAIKILKKKG